MEKKIIDQVVNEIDANRNEIVEFTLDMVKVLSENPPGNEADISELIKHQALQWGLPEPEIWEKEKNRPNLIFKISNGSHERSLILNGHIDTKPIGEAEEWIIDPYNPEIRDGKLYGRGSTDMKGAVAGIIAAVAAIINKKIRSHGSFAKTARLIQVLFI